MWYVLFRAGYATTTTAARAQHTSITQCWARGQLVISWLYQQLMGPPNQVNLVDYRAPNSLSP